MRVKATQRGYFGKLREIGDVFDVPDNAKGSWFKPVPKSAPAAEPDEDAALSVEGDAPAEPVPSAPPGGDAPIA